MNMKQHIHMQQVTCTIVTYLHTFCIYNKKDEKISLILLLKIYLKFEKLHSASNAHTEENLMSSYPDWHTFEVTL